MRIALLNENSQADKNKIIHKALKEAANGNEIINFGKYSKEDTRMLSYTYIGLQASILIATDIVQFVVTGCGTGQGASMSCNAFPNLVCGIINSPLDMYLFSQINAGNVISLAYAERYGWGSEMELKQIFDLCNKTKFGDGYPEIYAESQRKARDILMDVKEKAAKNLLDIYKTFGKDKLKEILDYPQFIDAFNLYAKENEITQYIKTILD